jgi:hypothetical protein
MLSNSPVNSKPRGRLENNSKIEIQEIEWVRGARTRSIWLRTGTVVSTVTNFSALKMYDSF